jgi:hypothetical protein
VWIAAVLDARITTDVVTRPHGSRLTSSPVSKSRRR